MDGSVKELIAIALELTGTFIMSCIATLAFSAQFGFEWSWLLSTCVWLAIGAVRYTFGGRTG